MNDSILRIKGRVVAELRDADGELKGYCENDNIVTDIGDQRYAMAGAGITSPPAGPTGMQLGTGSTAAAKNGAGAAIVTYLTTSDHTFDATYPSGTLNAGAGYVITYKCTYAAGEATSASTPITEAVISNKTLVANGAGSGTGSTAAQVLGRVLLTGIGSKQTTDTLTITWTVTIN